MPKPCASLRSQQLQTMDISAATWSSGRYEAVSSLSRSSPSLPVPGMNPHLHVQRPNKSKARRHHETCQNVAQHASLRALLFSGRWGLGFRIGLWPEKCLESFPASRMKDIAFKSFETGSLSGHLTSCCLTQPLVSTSSLCMTDACKRGGFNNQLGS